MRQIFYSTLYDVLSSEKKRKQEMGGRALFKVPKAMCGLPIEAASAFEAI